jgi:hypothetical protein
MIGTDDGSQSFGRLENQENPIPPLSYQGAYERVQERVSVTLYTTRFQKGPWRMPKLRPKKISLGQESGTIPEGRKVLHHNGLVAL